MGTSTIIEAFPYTCYITLFNLSQCVPNLVDLQYASMETCPWRHAVMLKMAMAFNRGLRGLKMMTINDLGVGPEEIKKKFGGPSSGKDKF